MNDVSIHYVAKAVKLEDRQEKFLGGDHADCSEWLRTWIVRSHSLQRQLVRMVVKVHLPYWNLHGLTYVPPPWN